MTPVNLNFEDFFGATFESTAIFTPVSTGWIDGTILALPRIRTVAIPSSGTASIALKTGNYSVVVQLGDNTSYGPYLIGVPDSVIVQQFTALIGGGVTPPNPSLSVYAAINGASQGITDLVGGGATNLDGLATIGVGSLFYFVDSVTYTFGGWQKIAGTNATDVGNGWLRPLDFNISTNPFVWKRRS